MPTAKAAFLSANPGPGRRRDQWSQARHFSSNRGGDDEESEDDDEDGEEDVGEISEDEEVPASSGGSRREYSPEEKEAEAAAIGYKVIGPLQESDKVFKPYEPVFAIVQVSGLSLLVVCDDSGSFFSATKSIKKKIKRFIIICLFVKVSIFLVKK